MVFRAFIAVDLERPELVTSLLEELANLPVSLKLVKPEQIHLTLKFLGNVEEARVPEIVKVMYSAVEGISPFEVTLQGVGAFPSLRNANVIWLGLKNAALLSRIASRLEGSLKKLGFPPEKREFTPHLTLARLKSKWGGRVAGGEIVSFLEKYSATSFGVVKIDRIRLKKSVLSQKGPTYYTVEEVML
jgi:2'-5' RNA ligase